MKIYDTSIPAWYIIRDIHVYKLGAASFRGSIFDFACRKNSKERRTNSRVPAISNDCTHTARVLRSWKLTDISDIVFRLPLSLIFDVKGNGRGGRDRYRFCVALYQHSFTAVSFAGPRKINHIPINRSSFTDFFHEYFSSILSLYKQGRERAKLKIKKVDHTKIEF